MIIALSRPGRALAGTQHGGHQGAGVGLEHQQGQVAMVAVGGIIGVVEIQGNRGRGARVAGDELFNQGAGHPVDVAAPQRSFQAGEGGAAGQQIAAIQRRPPRSQLEQRVAAQGVGIIAVLITRSNLKYALRKQIAQGVRDVAGVAGIRNGLGR
jgi:hypothetical protein